nr:MAG: RNA-dependent RNA polymerase [Fusarium oxysporum f. sp. cubense negative-stranded RNA virus 1]
MPVMTEFQDLGDFVSLEFERLASDRDRTAPEKHLDSPITDGLTRRLSSLILTSCSHWPDRIPSAGVVMKFVNSDPTRGYSSIRNPLTQLVVWMNQQKCLAKDVPLPIDTRLYPELFHTATKHASAVVADMHCAGRVYDKVVDAYLDEIRDVVTPSEVERVRQRLLYNPKPHPELPYYAANSEYWDQIVEDYRKESLRFSPTRRPRVITRGPLNFWHCEGYSIMRLESGAVHLITYEQLQMIQDACLARENVYACLSVGLHNGSERLGTHVGDIIRWQERCIALYGNDGYEIVKAPEAVYKAWINTLSSGDILADSSFNRTLRKIRDKERKLTAAPTMVARLESLCRRTTHLGDCMELFGLIKLSGHPTVYARRSALSVQSEAKPYLATSPFAIYESLRCFKHTILSNYIERETRWPPFKTPPAVGTLLHRHWMNRTTALPVNAYPLSDLDHIEFGKFLEFDYSEDFLKFLDDKAISPGAAETSAFWFGRAQKPKRLLLAALQQKKIDTKAIVQRLSARGFTLDEMVIELTQKERELKPAARCFCKLPLEVRCFFALTEYNLGEQLMKRYIPQQTMTMSTTETRSRLHGIATTGALRNNSGFLEIDFSRWNLRWRSRTVNPIGRVIEDIFGMPGTYTQGHWFFENATVVLTDRHHLPAGVLPGSNANDWPESDLVWRGHKGGFEGILQKLWTLCTIAMVLAALIGLKLSFLMAGQGDNQILAIVPSDASVSRQALFLKILASLEIFCRSLGHDVKPEECIDSSTVISYSKEFYVEGVHKMYTLKFASRTMKRDDSDVPSLSAEISGLCATATAVSDTLAEPLRAWWWQTFRLRRFFRSRKNNIAVPTNERRILRELLLDDDLFDYHVCLPGSIGGLPVQSHARFRIKGEVDDLIWDICGVLLLKNRVRGLSQHLAALVDGAYLPSRIDMTQLIADPRSIPIERPTDQRRLIKNAMRDDLPSLVKNEWISEVVNSRVVDVGETLIKALTTMKPMYPQIAQDIFKASLAGLSDSIFNRFTMTRTIKQVVGGVSFVREIQAGNTRLLRFIRKTYDHATSHRTHVLPDSAFEIARRLRSRWGIGDIQSAIGVYCPLEFPLTSDQASVISASLRTPLNSVHDTIGPYPPNFGTRTRQKRSEHGYKILDSADTLKDIRSLVMINSELHSGEKLRNCISQIISSRSPWNLNAMSRYLPTSIGGTAAHRHENLQSGFFCTLGSNTVPTHINYDTDNSGILSGGEDDYPIVFQEFFLCLNNHVSVIGRASSSSEPFTVRYKIPPELTPIPTAACEIDIDALRLIKWPQIDSSNRLAYLDDLHFSVYTQAPPSQVLPFLQAPSKVDILFSSIFTSLKYKPGAIISMRGAIIHTQDFLDIKEANRCTPHEIYLAASAAILCHALAAAQLSFCLRSVGVFDDALQRLGTAIAPQITKTLLHPSRRQQIGVVDEGIVMQPGGRLPLSAVAATAGTLVHYGKLLLKTQAFYSSLPNLVVGQDKLRQVTTYAKILAVATLVRGLNPNGLVTSPSLTRRLTRAEAFGMTLQSSSISLQEIYKEHRAIQHDYRLELVKKGLRRAANQYTQVPRIKIFQVNADQHELTRTLRTFAKLHNQVTNPLHEQLTMTWTPQLGRCSLVKSNTVATAKATQCGCPPDDRDLTRLETRKGYLWKTAGVETTARSVWELTLNLTRPTHRRYGVIGVGRGASAATILSRFPDSTVVGLDLRQSWPLITQRELSYCPPEVVRSGVSSRFEWADEVWSSVAGDVFKLRLSEWVKKYSIECLVIDIEDRHEEVLKMCTSLTVPTLGRWRICTHLLGAVLASCGKRTRLHNISIGPVTHLQIVGYLDTQGLSLDMFPGEHVVWNPFHPRPTRNKAALVARINTITRPWGILQTEASPAYLEQAATSIRQRYTNSSDISVQQAGAEAAKLLLFVARHGRAPPDRAIPDLLNNDTHPREFVRTALLYLSNMVVDPLSYL